MDHVDVHANLARVRSVLTAASAERRAAATEDGMVLADALGDCVSLLDEIAMVAPRVAIDPCGIDPAANPEWGPVSAGEGSEAHRAGGYTVQGWSRTMNRTGLLVIGNKVTNDGQEVWIVCRVDEIGPSFEPRGTSFVTPSLAWREFARRIRDSADN